MEKNKTTQIDGLDIESKEGMELVIRRFKNHCDIQGYPTKSFKQKVKQLINKLNKDKQ